MASFLIDSPAVVSWFSLWRHYILHLEFMKMCMLVPFESVAPFSPCCKEPALVVTLTKMVSTLYDCVICVV